MKVLLTGFEPFGGLDRNPSQEIVELIAMREFGKSISVHVETLKTEYIRSAQRITEVMDAFQPDVVLGLGVAVETDTVRLERFARNVNDSPKVDNAGELRRGERIAADGPDAYASGLPLHELQATLSAKHPRVVISHDAGAFVCNHVFYTASHYAKKVLSRPACGFIHVPLHDIQRDRSRGYLPSTELAGIISDAILFLASKTAS
jgi:pyroglutamyl-peptidase